MKKNAPRNSGVLFSVLMASLLTSWPGLGGHGDLAVAGGSVTRRVAAGNAATGSYRRVSSLSAVAGLSGLSAQAKAILFSSYGVAANLGLPTTGGLPTAASGGSPGSTAVCGIGQHPTVSTIDTAANGSSGVAMAAFAATLATFAPPGPAAIRPGAAENLACVYVTAEDSAAGMLTARAEAAALALRMAGLTPSSPSSLQLAASAAAQAQLGVAAENSLLGVQNLGLGSGALADPVTVTTDVVVATTVAQPTSVVDPATQLVTLSSATQGAAIYYTTDGSTPSAANGTLYTGPFAIPSSHNLETFGTDPAWTDSAPALVSNFDSIQPAVTISSPLASSTFSGMVSVTGTCNDSSPGAMVAISVSSSTSPGVSSSTVPCSGTNFMALSLDISGLADGPVTVSAVFTTANGSSSAAPVTFTKALAPVLLLDAATAQASGSPLSDTLACTGVTWADSSSSLLGPATLIDFDAGCSQGGFLGNGTPVDPYRVNFNNPANGYGQATTGSAGPAADTTLAHVLTPSVLTPGDFSVEIFARATPGQNVYSILSQYVFLPGPFTLSSGSTISATYGVPYFDGGVPVNTNAADSIEFFNSGNNPLLASAVGGVSSNGAFNQDATTTFEDGAWHQLVFVSGHNGVQVGKLYMDGVLTADTTLSRTGAVLAQMSIGADQANDEMGMVGDISRMAAYDQALGIDRIYQDCLQQSLRLAGLSCAGPVGGWPIVSTPSNLYLETNLAATVFGGSCDPAGSPVTVVYGPAATPTSTTAACLGGSFQTGNMDLSSLPTGPLPVIAFQTDANGVWEGNRYAYTILGRLAAPTNLAASVDPVSFDTIWSWQGSVGGDGIYRYSTFADPGPSPNPFWPTPTDSTDSYTTAAPLADGRYTIWVQEQDLAGSWGDTATSVDIITVLPPTLVGISTDPITNETTWTWMSGGSGDGVYEYSVGYDPVYYEASGVITTASTNSFTTSSPLSVGIHHFFVREQNAGGSWSQTSQFDVTIAAVGQPILVSSITDPSTSLTTWTWSSGGNGSGVYEFSVGYDPNSYETSGLITTASTNSLTTPLPLSVGVHHFFVRERNAAGDWSPTSQFDVTIPPVGQPILASAITDPSTSLTTWTWSSGGNGSGVYEFSVGYDPVYYETSGLVTVASTNTFTTLLPLHSGPHIFFVRERNAAGDWSPTSQFDVTIPPVGQPVLAQAVPPLTNPFTDPATNLTTWTWSSGGNGSGVYEFSVGYDPAYYETSGAITTASTNTFTTLSPLHSGPHIFFVRERNAAGDWSPTSQFDVTIAPVGQPVLAQAVPPLTNPFTDPATNLTTWSWLSGGNGSGVYEFSVEYDPAYYETSGVITTASSNSFTTTLPLSSGVHHFYVRERNAAGDWSPTSEFDVTVTPMPVLVATATIPNTDKISLQWASGSSSNGTGTFRYSLTENPSNGPSDIVTVPGSYGIPYPRALAVLGSDLYIATGNKNQVFKMSGGTMSLLAGAGPGGFSGDGGPAAAALLNYPSGVAVDAAGNVYIADLFNYRIRMVAETSGTYFGQPMSAGNIYTIAGSGAYGDLGDGDLAINASMSTPQGVVVDSQGNVYFVDQNANRVRVVYAATGKVAAFAGSGFTGNTGDAGPAIYATMNEPQGLGIDSLGNIYVSDSGNTSVRKINWENGIISTVPGLTTHGSYQIAVDGPGNIFVTDLNNNQVLVVAAATGFFFGEYMTAGTSYVLAGNSSTSETGDGLIAALAGVYGPVGVAVDSAENVYVADGQGNHIRIVTPADGLISSLTGNNPANFGGSGSLPPSYIYTSPLMPAGPQTITVYVQEADGNGGWGQTAILNAYTNFTGPPAPVLVSPSSLDVNTVSVTITWGSGGGSGAGIYQYSTEGDPASGSFAYSTVASNTPGGYNYTTTNIYQGTQTITLYVRERDALGEWGNTATLTTTVTYTPDGYHGLQ